jgi:tetratricopeptide (TPR) repeat protein
MTSREVVQPLSSGKVERLNRALLQLSRRPRQVDALLEAADASLDLNDYDAAIGFYTRAADVAPDDAQVKLGHARSLLRSGRPVDALALLAEAERTGASARELLPERGLALDMVGEQDRAQADYLRALELDPENTETQRRLALSYAISSNDARFEETLAPLLEARNFAAFRIRAFGLAILGEQRRAQAIVEAVMPPDLAGRITPYLAYMPRLTPAQMAAAANLGIFPRAANIGRDNPRIARFAAEGAAGMRLEPAGAPLGNPAMLAADRSEGTLAPDRAPASASPRPRATIAADTTVTSAGLPQIAAREMPRTQSGGVASPLEPASASQPRAALEPAASEDVAAAFAYLEDRNVPAARSSRDAVDITAIAPPREVASTPATGPADPERIWLQVATGRDPAALRFDWRRITRRADGLLADYKPHVTPWGQANRLLAGPVATREDARALINALAEKGLDTFSYVSPEGTRIQVLGE